METCKADRVVTYRGLDGEQFLRVALMLYETISSMGLPEDLHAEIVLAVVDRALATHLISSPSVA